MPAAARIFSARGFAHGLTMLFRVKAGVTYAHSNLTRQRKEKGVCQLKTTRLRCKS